MRNEAEERKFEVALAYLLRFGVLLSAIVVTVGAAIYLSQSGTELVRYHIFKGEPSPLRSFSHVFPLAFSLDGRAIMQVGLVLLIAIPFARVLFSEAVFLKERDWMYSAFTLVVLLILTFSLFGH